MKGLILKDLYAVRFQLIVSLVLMLIPCGVFTYIFAAAEKTDGSEFIIMMMCCILNYCCIVIFSSFVLNTVQEDVTSGWIKLQGTFPVKSGTAITAKFAVTFIVVGMLTLISLIFNITVMAILKINMNAELMLAIPIAFALMELIALLPCMVHKYKTTRAAFDYPLIMILTAIVGIVIAFVAMSGDISFTLLRVILYIILPVVTAAVAAASYSYGKKVVVRE